MESRKQHLLQARRGEGVIQDLHQGLISQDWTDWPCTTT